MSAGGATYSYDDSGFLTSFTDSEGTTDLTWSASGELLGLDGPSSEVTYEYDPAGVLVSRTDSTNTVGFVNDASMSLPHAVAASDGSWWVYAGARPLAQATSDGGVHYLHADVRGDVRVVTDAAASVTDSFAYSVDGVVTGRTGSTAVSVGWNGEYTDPDTGLVWLRARWYDPGSARFLSADPWHGNPAVPVSLNRYLFGHADPVNNTDPTGLFTMVEQQVSMELRLELNSISAGYYLGLLSSLRTATVALAATAGVLATGGAAYWAVTAQAGDPHDQEGIDGPGPIPDVEVHERDSAEVEVQPQPAADGAGARNGGPVGCEAEPGVVTGSSTLKDGVVYLRTNLKTGDRYIGQAKSWSRYVQRQKEHRRSNPVAIYDFKVFARAESGTDLDRAEQFYIDECGGPRNKSNPDGELDNYRNQMTRDRYREEGGYPWQ